MAVSATLLLKVLKSKCKDCCNGDNKEIKECTVSSCPLHAYRNISTDDVAKRKRKSKSDE